MEFKKANFKSKFNAGIYHFGIDTKLAIIGNIELDNTLLFLSVPEDEDIEVGKNKLIEMSTHFSPIALVHTETKYGEKLRDLINKTAQKFIEGKYDADKWRGGNELISLIGYRRLVNDDALLVIGDITSVYLEDDLLLGEAHAISIAKVLKNHGLNPKKVLSIDDGYGNEFMKTLKNDTEEKYQPDILKMKYDEYGVYFYNLINEDIVKRPIFALQNELNKNIDKKEEKKSVKLKI